MEKRTNYGTKIVGQIKGFRRFLETAEKHQLEALVERNPEYFYDILPYTYALDISEKWVKQFETIAISPPNWYNTSNSTFNTNNFTQSLYDTVKDVSDCMTFGAREERNQSQFKEMSSDYDSNSSSSDSFSSSSGGGSSGGGSGGRRRKFMVKICRVGDVS